jgi:hypothetical protein
LCQPRVTVKMIVEKLMECRLAGETEVLGENLPQRHFCPSQNPTRPDPGFNPGLRGGKPATNRLSYGSLYYTYEQIHRNKKENGHSLCAVQHLTVQGLDTNQPQYIWCSVVI